MNPYLMKYMCSAIPHQKKNLLLKAIYQEIASNLKIWKFEETKGKKCIDCLVNTQIFVKR